MVPSHDYTVMDIEILKASVAIVIAQYRPNALLNPEALNPRDSPARGLGRRVPVCAFLGSVMLTA